jgi:putative salt-induced outer membrane protein YdiY
MRFEISRDGTEMNSKKAVVFMTLLLSVMTSFAFGGEVLLKNGDRVTGKVVKKEGDSLFVETEAMGTVKIKLVAIERYDTEAPVALTLTDGSVITGVVRSEENSITVENQGTGASRFEPSAVKIIRTPEEQMKYENAPATVPREGIFGFWSGTLDIGFSMTTGNSDTRSFTGAFRGVREKPSNKLAVYANALQVRNSTNGPVRITGQSVWSGARLDADITKKWFVFGTGDFEYNKPQKLDIRAVLGGGGGYHIFRGDRVTLNLTGGFTNNYENFSTGLTRNSAEALLGQDLRVRINNRARLSNRFVVYPNLSNTGNYRALLDASLQTDLNDWLGWHLTVGNRYNSRPVSATEKNDLLMSTGLRVSFGKNRRR